MTFDPFQHQRESWPYFTLWPLFSLGPAYSLGIPVSPCQGAAASQQDTPQFCILGCHLPRLLPAQGYWAAPHRASPLSCLITD